MELLRQEYKLLTELKAVFHSAAAAAPDRFQLVCNLLVSGGKDSMALMHAAARIAHSTHFRTALPFRFQVIHFDHKTRNGDSTRDAQFVAHQSLALGLPVLHFVWPAKPSLVGESEPIQYSNFQSRASQWRRSTCRSLRKKHAAQGENWIFLTAHHAGDHAETVLMNLIRGCGKNGLMGLQQQNPETGMYRPFASWNSHSVLDYVAARNVPFREDATNAQTCYTRNAIRHGVLAAIRQINPKIEETLTQMSSNLIADSETRANAQSATTPKGLSPAKQPEITLTPSEIYDVIKRDYPEYYRLVTFQQVQNIFRHSAAIGPSKASPINKSAKKCQKIPLSKGWHATLDGLSLNLYPPATTIYPK
jgi:tRNA(Ile)-lysidine synthetase-like protein